MQAHWRDTEMCNAINKLERIRRGKKLFYEFHIPNTLKNKEK